MERIEVRGNANGSAVVVGEKLRNVQQYTGDQNVFIIVDSNVRRLFADSLPALPTYEVQGGEQSKRFETIISIYRWLLDSGASRNALILGVGGGVVSDITGFVASTFMRGVDFGFVATTLLAQIDASVGGKNGIDLDGYKNIVGTFSQPRFVICDVSMLATLSSTELSNGFAEMVKHAIIADEEQFIILEQNVENLLTCPQMLFNELVAKSIRIKANVVSADEHEQGLRKVLNLGHTWGHAVEKVSGLPHGKCVSIGLEFAARLSKSKGILSNSEYKRICNLLIRLNLPISTDIDVEQILEAMTRDKKRCGNAVDFILIKKIGCVVRQNIEFEEIRHFVNNKE